jgi:hypothetical protein
MHLVEQGNDWSAQYLVKHLRALDGGNLEDSLIALGLFSDHHMERLLIFAKKGQLSKQELSDTLTMLPLSLSDNPAGQLDYLKARRNRVMRVTRKNLSEQKAQALSTIDNFESEIRSKKTRKSLKILSIRLVLSSHPKLAQHLHLFLKSGFKINATNPFIPAGLISRVKKTRCMGIAVLELVHKIGIFPMMRVYQDKDPISNPSNPDLPPHLISATQESTRSEHKNSRRGLDSSYPRIYLDSHKHQPKQQGVPAQRKTFRQPASFSSDDGIADTKNADPSKA